MMPIWLVALLLIIWGIVCAIAGGAAVLFTAVFYGRSIMRKSLSK